MPTPGRAVIECHMPVGFEDPFCRSCGAQEVARGQGVGKVGSGAWLGDELDGSFWAS